MIIGIPKELKDNEYRVGLTPMGARELIAVGHKVLVEKGAGAGSGFFDTDYAQAGAEVLERASDIYGAAAMIVKVKEPESQEYVLLRSAQIVFTFFHLAASRSLFDAVVNSGITAIAYETLEEDGNRLPILLPMSEVAGRLCVQIGAHYLLKAQGGRGLLLGGVPGVEKGRVVILGAGTVGLNAVMVAVGLGAEVTVLDKKIDGLRRIEDLYAGEVETLASNKENLEGALKRCDLLIGALHLPGARTPSVVTREMVSTMRKGSVIVDVSVDQGGCVETTRPTTHSNPTFLVDGVLHYCVTNMPGAVPRTSTLALTNATLPYIKILAGKSLKDAIEERASIGRAVNVHGGRVTNRVVAQFYGVDFSPIL